MTFIETTPSSPDADTHHPATSSPITLNLQIPGLELGTSGPIVLNYGVLQSLAQSAAGVSGLAAALKWSIRQIEIVDGFALFRFDPPKIGDLLSARLSEEEFITVLRRLIAETSERISESTAVGQSVLRKNNEPSPANEAEDATGLQAREAAVCKLVRARVKVFVEPNTEAESLKLPSKHDLPRGAKREPTAGEATVSIEAITRDGCTAYDRNRRAIHLRGIQTGRRLQVGDELYGPFIPLPRRSLPALLPVAGANFVCRSADGEEFTVGATQLPLLKT